MAGKRTRSPAEAPGNQRPAKRARPPATPLPRQGNAEGTPNVVPKTSRAERAERRSRVQELEGQVKTLKEGISKLLNQQAVTRQLQEQLGQTTKERKEIEQQIKVFQEAVSQQSDGRRSQVQHLQERLGRAEEQREALERQLKLLEEASRGHYIIRGEVVQLYNQAKLMGEKSKQLVQQLLHCLEERQPQDPDQQPRPPELLEVLLGYRKEAVEGFEQQLEKLKEGVAKHIKQQIAVVVGAVSQQPELLVTDHVCEYRRKMSRVAARPVESAPPNSAAGRVTASWLALKGEVSHLAESYFPHPLCWGSLSPTLQEKLLRLTPKVKQYLEHDYMGTFIFQAWIWHALDEKVFSKGNGPWVGEHWAAYSQLQSLAGRMCDPTYYLVPTTTV